MHTPHINSKRNNMSLNLTDSNARSGACYEIVNYLYRLNEDILAEAEARNAQINVFAGGFFTSFEAFEEALFAVVLVGPFKWVAIPAVASSAVVNIYNNIQNYKVARLRADISVFKTEQAICDLNQFIINNTNQDNQHILSYDVLKQWMNYQLGKGYGPGFDQLANLVLNRLDDEEEWLKIARIGAANPHGKAQVLCAGHELRDPRQLYVHVANGIVEVQPSLKTETYFEYALDGTEYTPELTDAGYAIYEPQGNRVLKS
jgi:hypothetical protein